jgi:hypothetical protein
VLHSRSFIVLILIRLALSGNTRPKAFARQLPKHRVNLGGRQLRAFIEPPSQHSHVGAHDKLNDKLSRDGGILVGSFGKLVAHGVGNDATKRGKGNSAAAASG